MKMSEKKTNDEYRDIIEQLLQGRSDREKIIIIDNMLDILKESKKEVTARVTPVLPQPGEFPLYPGRVDAIKWLGKYWGKYLKYFGAHQDVLFQDLLGKLDPGLLQALKNQIRLKNRTTQFSTKLAQILPPKKERITCELQKLTQDEISKYYKLRSAVRQRSRKGLGHSQ